MIYEVTYTETWEYTERISANSEDEAIAIMDKMVREGIDTEMVNNEITAKVVPIIDMAQVRAGILKTFAGFDYIMGKELSNDVEFCESVSAAIENKKLLIGKKYSADEILEWAIKTETRKKLFGWY